MNIYFLIAGILSFLLGLVHSILGEYLIFQKKREKGKIIPSKRSEGLRERHLRIIWATWHLASVFGWCIGAILIKIALGQSRLNADFVDFLIQSVICAMFTGALLVLTGTKGKHPGWTVLLMITILLIIGMV